MLWRGQLRRININHRCVWCAEFFAMIERLGINLFGQRESGAACFCKANEFFEPRCTSCFKMHPGVEPLQSAVNGRIDGKYVASRMHAEFQVLRKSIVLYRIGDGCHVERKFFLKLRHFAHVVHTFVEASAEFWSDGL